MKRPHLLFNVLGVAFVTVFVVFPLYWSFRTAVSPSGFRGFWPRQFTWDNFDFLFEHQWFHAQREELVDRVLLVDGLGAPVVGDCWIRTGALSSSPASASRCWSSCCRWFLRSLSSSR